MKLACMNVKRVAFAGLLGISLTTSNFFASEKEQTERKVEVGQEESKRKVAGNLEMPFELLKIVVNPYSVSGMIISPDEEKILVDFPALQRQNFVDEVWKSLPNDIQKVLIDSGTVEFARQARMIVLRALLENISRFSKRAQVDERLYSESKQRVISEVVNTIAQKIELLKKNFGQLQKTDIGVFIKGITAFINRLDFERKTLNKRMSREIQASNSAPFHAAMLQRLATMIDNAATDLAEREYLYDLLADSSNSMEAAYLRLAKLVSLSNRGWAFLNLMPRYIPSLVGYSPHPWTQELLLAKVEKLEQSIPFLQQEVEKRAAALIPPLGEIDFYGTKAAGENLFLIFEKAKDAGNVAVAKKLVSLMSSTHDEYMRQEDAVLHHKPNVARPNTLKLNKLIRTALLFGSQHAYEDLDMNLGMLERYRSQSLSMDSVKREWNALLAKFTLEYLTEETLALVKKIINPISAMHKRVGRIKRLRGIFDIAYKADDKKSLRRFIKILSEAAKPQPSREEVTRYHYLANAFADQEGYKRLQEMPDTTWSAYLPHVPFFGADFISQWHEAIEDLYENDRALLKKSA